MLYFEARWEEELRQPLPPEKHRVSLTHEVLWTTLGNRSQGWPGLPISLLKYNFFRTWQHDTRTKGL